MQAGRAFALFAVLTVSLAPAAVLAQVPTPAEQAHAQALIKAAREAGLIGVWRRDCAKPTTPDNWGLVYTETVGGVTAMDDGGPDLDLRPTEIVAVTPLGAGQSNVIRIDSDGERLNLVVVVRDGRLRVMQSSGDGAEGHSVYIQDGRFTKSVGESPWFSYCRPG